MDIKTIAGIVGLVITLGGLFVQVGQILNRLEVVESRSVPDIVHPLLGMKSWIR